MLARQHPKRGELLLPGIGPSLADDLRPLGVRSVADLKRTMKPTTAGMAGLPGLTLQAEG
jgi:predicted RecB family nuclease